jgi:leucyl-tRNA synthetase
LVLFPFSPHICAELWERLGHTDLINETARWPAFDEALTRDETVEIAVQVKGKMRGRITVATDASEDEIVTAARELATVQRDLGDKPLRKTIVVPGRLVNLIA